MFDYTPLVLQATITNHSLTKILFHKKIPLLVLKLLASNIKTTNVRFIGERQIKYDLTYITLSLWL